MEQLPVLQFKHESLHGKFNEDMFSKKNSSHQGNPNEPCCYPASVTKGHYS